MSISSKGLDLIKAFEGFRAKAYKCPANVPTIGYGTTSYPDGKTREHPSFSLSTNTQPRRVIQIGCA